MEQGERSVEAMVERFSRYRGKRVLVTGHTGFKGGWLSLWLEQLGAEVHGLALDPVTTPDLYRFLKPVFSSDLRCDIRDSGAVKRCVSEVRPEVVFHLAAQPIVLESYRNPIETLEVNVMGTAYLLQAIRELEYPCDVVVVTSDKCYHNQEWEFSYREVDPLGGKDVYSASKAAAEVITSALEFSFFRKSEGLGNVATARGGNVIGGGDFSENRIVPDAMKAFSKGEVLGIRNPGATRPWQHVLDCLSGYLTLADWLATSEAENSEFRAFNFGPTAGSHRSVGDLVREVGKFWDGEWRDDSRPDMPHEAGRLAVSIDRAATILDWKPTLSFSEAVEATVVWYRRFYEGPEDQGILSLMREQIKDYMDRFERDV